MRQNPGKKNSGAEWNDGGGRDVGGRVRGPGGGPGCAPLPPCQAGKPEGVGGVKQQQWGRQRRGDRSQRRALAGGRPEQTQSATSMTRWSRSASTKRPLLRTFLPYITVLVSVIPCIIYS